jgi:4-carboxymuconolactone decarboxylase
MYPEDVDPESGCRLPSPKREELDEAGRRTYDSLADPKGGTIRGLKGPGGILLHSPELSRHSRPLNRYLRHEAGLGGAGDIQSVTIEADPAGHSDQFGGAPAKRREGDSLREQRALRTAAT